MKFLKYLYFLCVSFIFFGCSVMPQKEDRMTRDNDFFNRFSRSELIVLQAGKFGDEYFKLRKNKTFVFRSEFMGVKTTYYSGTYTYDNRVLKLKFDSDRGFDKVNSIFILNVKDGKPCFVNAEGWVGYIYEYNLSEELFTFLDK